jgi:hypothetical protein
MTTKHDPSAPFGGYGSPCGNLPLQRRYAELHAEDPHALPPVYVDFPDLTDCRECDMCGGCEIHEGCATDWNHLTWFMRFASPGEDACGAEGGPAGRSGHACALPLGHGGCSHQDRRGNGWLT